jgi:HipA-like protein
MIKPWASKSKMSFTTPPPTLLVSYNGTVVAELKRVDKKYSFRYRDSFKELQLSALPGLPYRSDAVLCDELPLFFKERLPDQRRPEVALWLNQNPQVNRNDDLQLLGTLGAHSITDSFVITQAAA